MAKIAQIAPIADPTLAGLYTGLTFTDQREFIGQNPPTGGYAQ